jgi:uracil-DNA glycosylase
VLDVDYHPHDPKAKDGDYNLVCCTENAWHDKKNKVLIVLETVDAQDLRAGRMLADRSRVVVQNIFNYAFDRIKWASQNVSKMNPKWVPTTKDIPYEKYTRKHTALSCVNFNQRKFFGESPEVQEVARVDALRRLNRIIDELQPTMVLVFGDDAARMLLAGRVLNHRKKRGWVFKMKTPRGHKYRMVPTLDLYDLYVPPNAQKMEQMRGADSDDDDGQDEKFKLSNLLFYVADHIQNALVRRLRFDLSEMTTKVVFVNSMSKFKDLWARLQTAEVVAVDTETKNLSVNNNAVNTMQFSVDGNVGYVLPLRHPQSPFSASQLDIIESKLRKWFYARPGKYPLKYLIMQNGKYDLRVIRAEYGIPLIYHPVWEIMAGEYCFHGDTLVETENGRKKIRDLVDDPNPPRVWSQNLESGTAELKPIVSTSSHPTKRRMMELELDNTTIRVTEDHKVWSVTRKSYVEARDLDPGEEFLVFDEPSKT